MYKYSTDKKIVIVTGHFGAGKTNVAVNLARSICSSGKRTVLIDFDIVNPFFRAADCRAELEAEGIRCIVPEYANSNVDVPSLPPDISAVLERDNCETAVFDVGGDDSGATALAVYSDRISARGYEMLYVINMYRPLTSEPEEAVSLMREIELHSRLRCTAVVNNSNLALLTSADTVKASEDYAAKVCKLAGLPLLFTSAIGDAVSEGNFKMTPATKKLF
ncbi:MAG: ParA family protein [Firmicutes bacterium]|nr:ParA family protein [Bacillota bacterium]